MGNLHTLRFGILGISMLALAAPARAQVVRQVVNATSEVVTRPALETTGATAYAAVASNQLGGDPGYSIQIFKFSTTSSTATQLTSFADGVSDAYYGVSVSDDGQWLAFIAPSNPLGTNPNKSPEI